MYLLIDLRKICPEDNLKFPSFCRCESAGTSKQAVNVMKKIAEVLGRTLLICSVVPFGDWIVTPDRHAGAVKPSRAIEGWVGGSVTFDPRQPVPQASHSLQVAAVNNPSGLPQLIESAWNRRVSKSSSDHEPLKSQFHTAGQIHKPQLL